MLFNETAGSKPANQFFFLYKLFNDVIIIIIIIIIIIVSQYETLECCPHYE